MIDKLELDNRFTYHAPKEGQPRKYELIRQSGKALAEVIMALCPMECRETALAVTKLEEAVMLANAAIARRGA